ncbi:hypothetical protein ACHAWF_017606 [Thalassiosira exigua]
MSSPSPAPSSSAFLLAPPPLPPPTPFPSRPVPSRPCSPMSMRRLAQSPPLRPHGCRAAARRNYPGSFTSTSGVARFGSGGESVEDGDASLSARFTPQLIQHILPPPRGFEASSRQLSFEAVSSLSPRGSDFTVYPTDDVLLNPLSNSLQGGYANGPKDPDGFLELFKVISTLNRQSVPGDLSILDVDFKHDSGGMEAHDTRRDEEESTLTADASDTAVLEQSSGKEKIEMEADNTEKVKHGLKTKLIQALRTKHLQSVVNIFEQARSSPHHDLLDDKQIDRMFVFFLGKDILKCYQLLTYIVERCKEQGRIVRLDLYLRLIERISFVRVQDESRRHNHSRQNNLGGVDILALQNLADDLAWHIQEEYSQGKTMVYQYLLLPTLVLSLSKHRHPAMNQSAKPIMEHIMENQFPPLCWETFEGILTQATESWLGSHFLPYHSVLSWLVSNGHRPKPENVMNVLQAHYPFTDFEATREVLSTIQQLHPDVDSTPSAEEDYCVDLGTLEAISVAASKKDIDLCHLVWDLADLFGYSATESMFEDIIMSFAATGQSENMFSAIVDMSSQGFEPSQSLLKYVALKLSSSQKRLDHCYKMMNWYKNDHVRSIHSMNALLLGYGKIQDIDSAFIVYGDLEKFGIQPDANTFIFLLESLYIDTIQRFRKHDKEPLQCTTQDIDDVVGAAQVILDTMEESEITKSKSFIGEHIKLLCAIGLVEDAYSVLEEAISTGTPVPRPPLFMLMSNFASMGNYDTAHNVAQMSIAAGCGEDPTLAQRISNIRKRGEQPPRRV